MFVRSLALFLLAPLLLAACGEPFEPFAPSDLVFSIHGTLDASADTQYIRVRPLQGSQETLAGSIDAVVTLEELETGTVIQMSDSLIRYQSPNLDELGVSGHNFFTTMPMVPGRNYRLTATRSDGAASTATVLVPPALNPTLSVTHFTNPSAGSHGVIRGFPHIAMIFGDADVPTECDYFAPVYRQFYLPQESSIGGYYTFAQVDASPPKRRMNPPEPSCPLGEKRIIIIASGERWEWPRGITVDTDEALAPFSATNNIEDGLGFLAGINRWVLPSERCVPVSGASCDLFYTPSSATLVGHAFDSCTGLPVADADIQLIPSSGNAIRIARTHAGMFRISGLSPGSLYTFTVRRPGYFDYMIEPLSFQARAVDTVTFTMVRWVC